jgi:ribosomal protein RSM22 (predicted rRNA methylase)
MLPSGLADALAALDAPPQFAERAKRLSERYRADGGAAGPVFADDHDRTAYALTRMPATAAAIADVLRRAGVRDLASAIDLGSGTGAGLWAAAALARPTARLVAVDRDDGLVALARRLVASGPAPLPRSILLQAELGQPRDFGRADLVMLNYVVGELSDALRPEVLRRAWSACGRWLAVIEPGTPRGFQNILAARRSLITAGAAIAAPCTHRRRCPLAESDPAGRPKAGQPPGWCHFSVRVPRSAAHRAGKGGRLGHEDETYCYVVAERITPDDTRADGRILSPPLAATATRTFATCTTSGLAEVRVTNRMGAQWKAAKDADWGDLWGERRPPT